MSAVSFDLSLDHGGASVADLARSVAFYRDVLGFEVYEEFSIPGTDVRGVVMKQAGGACVELFHRAGSLTFPRGGPIDSIRQQGWFQLAFRVGDLAQVFEHVLATGAAVSRPPFTAPDGISRVAFIFDPDGNLIELVQRAGA